MLRTVIVAVRLTPEERDIFERAAHKRGLQLSSWMRMNLLDRLKRESA